LRMEHHSYDTYTRRGPSVAKPCGPARAVSAPVRALPREGPAARGRRTPDVHPGLRRAGHALREMRRRLRGVELRGPLHGQLDGERRPQRQRGGEHVARELAALRLQGPARAPPRRRALEEGGVVSHGDLGSRQCRGSRGSQWVRREAGNPCIDHEPSEVLVVQLLCSLSGGPQQYTGRPIDVAHKHLAISEKDGGPRARERQRVRRAA
jgi:hypothetical protein